MKFWPEIVPEQARSRMIGDRRRISRTFSAPVVSGALALVLVFAVGTMLPASGQEPESKPAPRRVEPTGEPAGTVSYLGNRAWRHPDGGERRWALRQDARVYVGDAVVAEGGSVEIELLDGSALRIASGSRLELDESAVGGEQEQGRSVSVRLIVGRAWATVTGALGGDDKFEVRTQTAAAGVRGTSFRVDAREDASTLVRVYQGAVAVAGIRQAQLTPPEPQPERVQVQGPAQVSREEWEQRVEAMMSVEISATGRVGEPTPFDPDSDLEDPWVRWNRQRDSARSR